MKVFLVVRHYHIAASSQRTLVLQHVLIVFDKLCQSDVQLLSITRKNRCHVSGFLYQTIAFSLWST
ncbi:MAG: hypothetical protein IJ762_10400 [Bacteroidaceae bacterium]|nr:hypothetical protein [Bacteroidaceae bacterium]